MAKLRQPPPRVNYLQSKQQTYCQLPSMHTQEQQQPRSHTHNSNLTDNENEQCDDDDDA